MRRRFAMMLALSFVATSSVWAQSPVASPGPSASSTLSGRWRFNPEKSDDPREKMREAMQSAMGGRGGGMGGSGGMGGRGGGGRGGVGMGGRGGGRSRGEGGREQAIAPLLDVPQEMTITHTAEEIAILEKDGRVRALHPDGKTHKSERGTTEIKTRWNKDRLIVETKQNDGPEITETFKLSPNGSQLYVDVRLQGGLPAPVTVRRVYDVQAEQD